jgi:hypothetical protein
LGEDVGGSVGGILERGVSYSQGIELVVGHDVLGVLEVRASGRSAVAEGEGVGRHGGVSLLRDKSGNPRGTGVMVTGFLVNKNTARRALAGKVLDLDRWMKV